MTVLPLGFQSSGCKLRDDEIWIPGCPTSPTPSFAYPYGNGGGVSWDERVRLACSVTAAWCTQKEVQNTALVQETEGCAIHLAPRLGGSRGCRDYVQLTIRNGCRLSNKRTTNTTSNEEPHECRHGALEMQE